mmetsp:Transcript_16268/g.48746  ORF Transcript_16268/g.48746 Transcript_16268/m.48746 type:complete len:326 (-) Transcript_16268:2463-3440(-)
MSTQELLETEKICLQQLKDMMKERELRPPKAMLPGGDLDATLVRYLRARKWTVAAACDMLAETINWREDKGIDQYLSCKLPGDKEAVIRRFKSDGLLGNDNKGRPVFYEQSAITDLNGMLAAGCTLEDYEFVQIRNMEYMVNHIYPESSAKAGHLIDSHIVLSDFSGAGLGLLGATNLKVFGAISKIYQSYYPELMGQCLISNAPMVMSLIYKGFSIFMDQGTQQKVKFVKCIEDLTTIMDENIVPGSLGGKRPESDKCLTNKDGFVPDCWKKMDQVIERQAATEEARRLQTAEKAVDGIVSSSKQPKPAGVHVVASSGAAAGTA